MKIKIESGDNSKAVSIDQIIDMFMENAESDPKNEKFDFIKTHEQNVMAEIKYYSRSIRNPEFDNISERELECVAENQSSKLLNEIYLANIAYLKNGMKLGAELLLELLC